MEANDHLHAPATVPRGKIPWSGPQSRSGCFEKERNPPFFPLTGIHPRFLRSSTRNLVTMLNELPQPLRKEQEVMHLPVENVYTNRLLSAV